jgi:hypothetical protein
MKIPAPGGDDDGGGEAAAGDGAGEVTRGMFVCMLRVVGTYTKINTKWFKKKKSKSRNPRSRNKKRSLIREKAIGACCPAIQALQSPGYYLATHVV